MTAFFRLFALVPLAPVIAFGGEDAFLESNRFDQGKAEFDTYDAKITQYGEARDATVTFVWVKEPWDAERGIKAVSADGADFDVIKQVQIFSYPTGIYRYEQMWSGFWHRDTGDLVKFAFSHHEACGNTYKRARIADGSAEFQGFSYFENEGDREASIPVSEDTWFYEELPLRLRAMAHQPTSGERRVSLVPTVVHSRIGDLNPTEASIRESSRSDEEIEFVVTHANGTDTLVFAATEPHTLQRWQKANGDILTLRQSLFTDYWNRTSKADEKLLE